MKAISAFIGNRLNEWIMVICLFGLSLQLFLLTPDTSSGSEKFLLQYLSPDFIGLVYLVVCYCRACALVINGQSLVYGPQTRAMGALAGALIWGQMDISLIKLYVNGVTANSPGISLYFAMTIGELFTVYRAATDVRRSP